MSRKKTASPKQPEPTLSEHLRLEVEILQSEAEQAGKAVDAPEKPSDGRAAEASAESAQRRWPLVLRGVFTVRLARLVALLTLGTLLFALAPAAQAQVDFDWARAMGVGGGSLPLSPPSDEGRSIAVDASGNVFTTGIFFGTVDFDPGAGVFNLTSNGHFDIFVSKLDSDGNFVWARAFGLPGRDEGHGIAVDASGNVLLVVEVLGDIYIAKLDSDGNLVWARAFGSTDSDKGFSIAVDASGSVYTTGSFRGTVDFDPGAGVFNLTSNGHFDIFVSKLDSDGNFVWARAFGSTALDEGSGIAVDASGGVFTTGYFRGTVDFDPGPDVFNLIGGVGLYSFVSKLDSDGNFVWARAMGGTDNTTPYGIAVDPSGGVFTTGAFRGTVDFDPGPEVFLLASNGTISFDIFVSKLDSNGDFAWARAFGSIHTDFGFGIAVDASGNVYTTGFFSGTIDFDPGAGVFNLISNGFEDVFISKLDSDGDFVWARAVGGLDFDEGRDIAVDASGSVLTTGHFRFTVDFDPGVGVFNLTSNGSEDIFVSKLRQTGTITIIKNTVPDGPQDFAFSTSGGLMPATFDLDDDDDGALPNTQTFTGVMNGSYTVTETTVTGFDVAISCTDPDGGTTTSGATAMIDLDGGEDVTCTFTNEAFPIFEAAKTASFDDPDGDEVANPGDVIAYQVLITNTGEIGLQTSFTDTVDPNTRLDCTTSPPTTDTGSLTSCDESTGTLVVTLDDLAGGATATITFEVQVPSPAPAGLVAVSNQGSVTADNLRGPTVPTDGDPATVCEPAGPSGCEPTVTPVKAAPDLVLAKDDSGVTVIPGGVINYTLNVTNNGNQDATGVTLNETVPDNTTFDASGSDADWTCIGTAPGSTCALDLGALAGGGGIASVVFAVTVDNPLSAGVEEVANTASVTDDEANGDDPNPEDNTATDTTPVSAMAMLSTTLTDALASDEDSDGQADPGDTLEYTATISNTGDQDAADVVYTQTVDANTSLSCASVDPGAGTLDACTDGPGGALTVDLTAVAGETVLFKHQATAIITFQATVNTPLSSSVTEVTTQGTVEFTGESGPENVATDDPATTPSGDETSTSIDQEADLALSKTASTATPDYQSEVVYTLRVTNDGPTEPASATVEDALPEGLVYVSHTGDGTFDPDDNTWATPGVSASGTAQIMITARVEIVDPTTNTACITEATFPDPDESDNCDEAAITPVAADLALVKSLVDFSGAGTTITATFTLTVTNAGPSGATGVVVSDPLPEGATLVSATGTGTYSTATGLWTIGALADGASASITLVMTAEASNNLVNIAEVSAEQPDQDESNNVAAALAQHDNPALDRFRADLSLVKTVDNPAPSVGEEVTFTLSLANSGPSATASIAVRDVIAPDSLVEIVRVETTGSASYSDTLWSVGHLPDGGTATLRVTVRLVGAGTLTNTAEVIASTLPDPDSGLGNGASDEDDFARVTITASGAQAGSQAAVREGPEAGALAEAPTRYELGANYPNPFNPETVIPYAVPEVVPVRIAVYDLLGREVAVLVDREQAAGRYKARWQPARVATGVYLVRMQAGSFMQVQRVTVVR